jgi:hypothetical protein
MNEVDEELPRIFQTLIRLAEIAKERDLNISKARRVRILKKGREKKGGVDVVAAKRAPTPTSDVVSTTPKKAVLNNE